MIIFGFETPSFFNSNDIQGAIELYAMIYGDKCTKHTQQMIYQSDILNAILDPIDYISGETLGGYTIKPGFQLSRKRLMHPRTLAQTGFLPFEHPTLGYFKTYEKHEDPGIKLKPQGHFMVLWDLSASNDHPKPKQVSFVKWTEQMVFNMELINIMMLLEDAKRNGHKASLYATPFPEYKGHCTTRKDNTIRLAVDGGGETIIPFESIKGARIIDGTKFEVVRTVDTIDEAKYLLNTAQYPGLWFDREEDVDKVLQAVCATDEQAIIRNMHWRKEMWSELGPFIELSFRKADVSAKGTIFIFTDFAELSWFLDIKPYLLQLYENCDIFAIHVKLGNNRAFATIEQKTGDSPADVEAAIKYGLTKGRVYKYAMEVLEDIDTLVIEVTTIQADDGKTSKIYDLSGATKGSYNPMPRTSFFPVDADKNVEVSVISCGNKGKVAITGLYGKSYETALQLYLGQIYCKQCNTVCEIAVPSRNELDSEIVRYHCHECNKLFLTKQDDKKIIPRTDMLRYVVVSKMEDMPVMIRQSLESAGYEGYGGP